MSADERLDVGRLNGALRDRGLDGWLVYDFHGINPVARRMLGSTGMLTRRLLIWLPAVGAPTLVVHNIDRRSVGAFPGEIVVYSTWQQLHETLAGLVGGRQVAMETFAENAVPYLDLVPHGFMELVRGFGATVSSSASLITEFAAQWSAQELADHHEVAEAIAEIARATVARVVRAIGTADEYTVQQEVIGEIRARGYVFDDPPIVAFGPHAADPHYSPEPETSSVLEAGQVVLLDLWARKSANTVWADQTWMGYAGGTPPDEVQSVFYAVVAARDAAVAAVAEAARSGRPITGADVDSESRNVLSEKGFGDFFTHRTGHSIDLDLHGSGPHLDNFETHDVRELLPGVAFSVEPGVYIRGKLGVRSEINVVLGREGPIVTPREPQRELIV